MHSENKVSDQVVANSGKANKPELLIAELLKDLRYGSLEIVVHDGRIVQIERKEKLRFDANSR
jgi:hypothetical protein